MPETMRAAVFKDVRDIHIEEVAMPRCGPTDAIVKITTTTICGTDLYILKGDVPTCTAGRRVGHADQEVNIPGNRTPSGRVVVAQFAMLPVSEDHIGEVSAVAAGTEDEHRLHPGEPMPPDTPMCSTRGRSP